MSSHALANIKQLAGLLHHKILLADATDERIIHAARIATDSKLAVIVLIGDQEEVRNSANKANISLDGIDIWSFDTCPILDELTANYYESRKAKVPDIETARAEIINDHLLFGALIVHHGDADGMLGGSLSTSGAIIRAAIRGIGLASNVRSLSSLFLIDFSGNPKAETRNPTIAFADCAVIPNPDAHQLADIALSTAQSYEKLTGTKPRVAMLSFSTKGSAESDSTKIVMLALEIAKERNPELIIDGELQFDAAFIPSVAERKAPNSPLSGNANVFIFPNLDAGNIGYKIAERLGGGQAIGPILQGLAKPMNDLSRGASVDDIVTMIAVTAAQGMP
ncbi:MAG TPA: phosphate acetyltransferase [Candidatus Kapabacteria bacterium]|nr:phosphate acetyltransferase [Candidatus Kapabacteria bacterium]